MPALPLSRRAVLPILAVGFTSCSTPTPLKPGERYRLTRLDLISPDLQITDGRPTAKKVGGPADHGYRIGDESLDVDPVKYFASELRRTAASRGSNPKLDDFLFKQPITLSRFEVLLLKRDITSRGSGNPQPLVAAFDSLVRNVGESASSFESVAVYVEIEVAGKYFGTRAHRPLADSPLQDAPVKPAEDAIGYLLDQLLAFVELN